MKKQAFKRISSAFLAIVTVFVMLPSFALPTYAWSWKDDAKFEVASYNVPIVSDGDIFVDAELDDLYLSGTKITSYPDEEPYKRNGYTEEVQAVANANFIAYVAVDTMGMYVYAEIEDTTIFETTNTNGNDGDCLQLYFDWCTPDIVHPSPEELYEMYCFDGVGWNSVAYKSSYGVAGLQYIGWLSADYNGAFTSSAGFTPHISLGPEANDAVIYDAKLIDGGWACEWFIPWRDDEQKEMIANGEQFHCGIGFQACDDSDIDDTCTPDREENVGFRFDQRREIGINYWSDYSRLADLVFFTPCSNANGHDYEVYQTISPTCEDDGYTVEKCSHCGTTVNKDYVSKLGHDYKVIKSLAPTCEKYGYTITQCTRCFDSINEAIGMIDHNFVMGYCTMCGKAYNTVKVDSARVLVGNTFDVTINATINEGIWSMAFELPIDADVFEFVSADTSNSIFSQFAVCEFDKTTSSYKFNAYNSSPLNNITNGGELVTLTLKVKDGAPGNSYDLELELLDKHIINVNQEKIAFSAESGIVEIVDQILGDANGDGDVTNADVLVIFRYIYNAELYPIPQLLAADVNRDGSITNSDVLMIFRYIYNSDLYPFIDVCDHSFGDWEVEKLAGCTEEGSLIRTCAKCEAVERQVLNKSHSYQNVVISPTQTERGYTLHVCVKCGHNYKDSYVPALGSGDLDDDIGNLDPDINLGGNEVTIISRGNYWFANEVSVEETSGDPIEAAVFQRNLDVERILNCTLVNYKVTELGIGGTADYEVVNQLKNTIGPDCPYDIMSTSAYTAFENTAAGLCQNLLDVDHLNLSNKYWSPYFNENATVGNQQYFATGAISLSLRRFIFVTFFNSTLTEDRGIEDLYTVVNEGRWTLDYQAEIINGVFQELDGVEGKTEGDFYGFVTNHHICVDPYWAASDVTILTKDEDDYFALAPENEKLDSILNKIKAIYKTSGGTYSYTGKSGDTDQNDIRAKFTSEYAMMVTLRLLEAEADDFRSMDNYGILPIPKYDKSQKEYYSLAHDQFAVYGIVSTVPTTRVDDIGSVLECMAIESYRTVSPVYYSTVLKGDYSDNIVARDILDMIVTNVKIDSGLLYTIKLGDITQQLRNTVKNDSPTISTTVFSAFGLKALNKTLSNLNKSIQNLQGAQ